MAKKIRNGVDAIFDSQPVLCPERTAAGLMGAGIVFGSIWDTDDNGVVIQFAQGKFFARFLIGLEELAKAWNVQEQMFIVELAQLKLLVMADESGQLHTKEGAVQPYAGCVRNKRQVPIWTSYW
jgi:hypothetical protein